jgi:ATP synthase protein I
MAGTLLQTKGMKSFGRYGSVGFELLASIAVGYYLGHWLDGKLGTRWLGLVGFLLGCYAGFRALFRTAKQMQRDIEREERLEHGEDPWAHEYAAPAREDEPSDDTSVASVKAAISSGLQSESKDR